ncbi:MAG: tRNA(Ile)-lysidine synthetase [Myxococcales bacterium]|nr:tRNA(Ile)-lysidine synthetase [Myxococcales bacterium]
MIDPIRTLRAAVARALEEPLVRGKGGSWLVACSGGPDSTALLDALEALGHLTLHVAAVDHGLRPEAAAEAAAVVAAAEGRGLTATLLRVTVDGRSMAAARRARYDALAAEAHRIGAGVLATGRTATDQAETLLDRLVRGAGSRGLGAMAPLRRMDAALWLARPLLSVAHTEVEAYVAARGLAVVRDPTNGDVHYRRSRLRHEVLPLLRRERPDLDRALAETAARLRGDADALDAVAAESAARLIAADGSLDAGGLDALPEAIFARVVARASGLTLGSVHVAALKRLCGDRRGTRSLDLPSQIVAERRYDRLSFGARATKEAPPVTAEVAVSSSGIYLLDRMSIAISSQLYESLGAAPLVLRFARAGDRTSAGKVQDLLVNRKVPRPERARLPVLARGKQVVWIEGVRLTGKIDSNHAS